MQRKLHSQFLINLHVWVFSSLHLYVQRDPNFWSFSQSFWRSEILQKELILPELQDAHIMTFFPTIPMENAETPRSLVTRKPAPNWQKLPSRSLRFPKDGLVLAFLATFLVVKWCANWKQFSGETELGRFLHSWGVQSVALNGFKWLLVRTAPQCGHGKKTWTKAHYLKITSDFLCLFELKGHERIFT